jgi:cytochrome c oxidase cbb3-type subunit II
MKMSPFTIFFGGLVIFASVLFIAVILPWKTISQKPSDIYRMRTEMEDAGRKIYVANGCTYCHTQFIRHIDWDIGAERVAQSGDYISEQPHLLGTERIGPDLSQAGGEHPDDWHKAHFTNPRFVRPESIMPNWAFLGTDSIKKLIAYVQSLGFSMADYRVKRQVEWKQKAIAAYEAGPDKNAEWLNSEIPEPWRSLHNPYSATEVSVERGKRIFQSFCIGCHGPVGDGMGLAQPYIYPPPLNFTLLRDRGISGGILYYQIMNGITGTAMPYFKHELESEKIWDVGNYVAIYFIGRSDAGEPPRGIDAAYEGPRKEN